MVAQEQESPNLPARSFVGRHRDLGDLQAALAEAMGGRGSLVLMAGEPGIGKTRLAEELAEQAKAHGVRVLWGSCWEGAGAPAFWPWIQVLRAYLQDLEPAALTAELGPFAAELARLVPEIGERCPDLPAAPALEPEQARFRLFDAVAGSLTAAAATRPLLLVLDDLHWADAPSLVLLRFLTGELRGARLLALGTYRDVELSPGHPLGQLLGDLSGERRQLLLGGLSREEVGWLITRMTAKQPGDQLTAAVHGVTGGNPFFVREIVRLLVSQVRLGQAERLGPSALAVPHGVREVIGRRLGQLSAPCREDLAVASVLGSEFRLDLLSAITGRSLDAQLELLDEAVAARLIKDAADGVAARYRFAHALVREALYERLSAARRIALHRRTGQAIERQFGSHLEPWLAELAYHFLRAAADGKPDKAVEYATRAGHRALGLLAYEEAAAHFEYALEALELEEPMDQFRRCELLVMLGDAQMAASQTPQARTTYERAATLASGIGAAGPLAHAALGVGLELTDGVVDELQVRLLEKASGAMADTDSALRARVLARLAKALLFTPARARRIALSEQAVQMARRTGDSAALAAALFDRHSAIWGPGNAEDRLAIATEVVRLAEATDDRVLALKGRGVRMADLLELGELRALQAELQAYERGAQALRQHHYLWPVPLLRAAQAVLDGRFDEAEQLTHESLVLGQRARDPAAAVYFAIVTTATRWIQGRLAELEDATRDLIERYPAAPGWREVLAVLLSEAGRTDEARGEFDRLAADDFAGLPRDHLWMLNMALLASACHTLGDTRRAATLYELLLPFGGCNVLVARAAFGCLGSASHYLGLLAATMSRWDDAAAHLEAAVSMHRRMGALPLLARSRYQHAQVLLARGGPGDRQQAEASMGQALTAARSFGMHLGPEGETTGLAGTSSERRRPAVQEAVLCKEGEYWTVTYRTPTFRLQHTIGLGYLARLISAPGREFHVVDLVLQGARAAGAPDARRGRDTALTELRTSGFGDAGTLLDPQAKAAYRRRLSELAEELQEAETWGDLQRAARARAETDALTEQLAAAVGLGGRDRRAATEAERARVSVTKAIRAAVRRIAEHDPDLGDHLTRSVRTGTFCAYDPDPTVPVAWRL